jgi:hypothetical protein
MKTTKKHGVDLSGRVRNFNLPKHRPLVPLYEAVVNSIHAIEARKKTDTSFNDGTIKISVIRSLQTDMEGLSQIDGFIIEDNGIGFTDANMESFMTCDSKYKAEEGGKGVGRLSWLKAFAKVEIKSIFERDGQKACREFAYTSNSAVEEDFCEVAADVALSTKVMLSIYKDGYNSPNTLPKQIETVGFRVVQHCLEYFASAECPTVTIVDETEGTLNLNKVFTDKIAADSKTDTFVILDKEFSLLHLKLKKTTQEEKGNRLYLCANKRLVDRVDLEARIANLNGMITDSNEPDSGFWYIGILNSAYFDENVDMNRLSFSLPQKVANLVSEISIDGIVDTACSYIQTYLKTYLDAIKEKKDKAIQQYVTQIAPQYQHLLKYCPEAVDKIKPNLSDDELDDKLSEIRRDFDKATRNEFQGALKTLELGISLDKYAEVHDKLFAKISESNRACLADYVLHRRTVIELLCKGLDINDDGKFNKEEYLHSLIYPMRATSSETPYKAHNLWLIDEKLAFCHYISSDNPFNNSAKEKRPDILCLDMPIAVADAPNSGEAYNSITVFELKRPQKNDYTEQDNPITQLLEYVRKIREDGVNDNKGRPIKVTSATQFYLYAVCDESPSLKKIALGRGLKQTPDKMGYYDYNVNYNAYMEILSYDKIKNDARKRNLPFFTELNVQ